MSDQGMTLEQFKIGEPFYTVTGKWICVDVGIYFVLAVKGSAYQHYVTGENTGEVLIFDRWDFGGCYLEPTLQED